MKNIAIFRVMAAVLCAVLVFGTGPAGVYSGVDGPTPGKTDTDYTQTATPTDFAAASFNSETEWVATQIRVWNANSGGDGELIVTEEGDTVTVTGSVKGAAEYLYIFNIPDGVTLEWNANLQSTAKSGAFSVSGMGGVFNMTGGSILLNPADSPVAQAFPAASFAGVTVNISGGEIRSASTSGGNVAIYASSGEVNITGGSVSTETAKGEGGRFRNETIRLTNDSRLNIGTLAEVTSSGDGAVTVHMTGSSSTVYEGETFNAGGSVFIITGGSNYFSTIEHYLMNTVVNFGTIESSGSHLFNYGHLDNRGILINSPGGEFTNYGSINNSGTISNFGTVNNESYVYNSAGGTIANHPGSLWLGCEPIGGGTFGSPSLPASAGPFTVTGGVQGADWEWDAAGRSLIILTDVPVTISGEATLDNRGYIVADSSANITLAGVTIPDYGSQIWRPALYIQHGVTVNLTLAPESVNRLYGSDAAGIYVPAGTTLNIDGEGALYATGGKDGSAGIGGSGSHGSRSDGGTMNIRGGTITAVGGGLQDGGAGIGGGNRGSGGNITISGGTVRAAGGGGLAGGAGIGGGGSHSGGIAGSGGNIIFSLNARIGPVGDGTLTIGPGRNADGTFGGKGSVTFRNGTIIGNTELLQDALIPPPFLLAFLTINDGATLTIGAGIELLNQSLIQNYGTIVNYGTVNNETIVDTSAGSTITNHPGSAWTGNSPRGDGTFVPPPALAGPFFVEGGTSPYYWEWDETNRILTVHGGSNVTIIGAATPDNRGSIAAHSGASITLAGVTIPDYGGQVTRPALEIKPHYSMAVYLNLAPDTVNRLYGSDAAAIYVPSSSTLVIGGGGTLYATGGKAGGAGIGGSGSGSGTVTINGGTIIARGGGLEYGSAGIGGGSNRNGGAGGGSIFISGGTVVATGGGTYGGAGIGGGYRSDGGSITISGGTVSAAGSGGGAGIGGGGARGGESAGGGGDITIGYVQVRSAEGGTLTIGAGRNADGTFGGKGHIEFGSGPIIGDMELLSDATVSVGIRTIDNGATLTLGAGIVLRNQATIQNNGTIQNYGTVNNENSIYNPAGSRIINFSGSVWLGREPRGDGTFVPPPVSARPLPPLIPPIDPPVIRPTPPERPAPTPAPEFIIGDGAAVVTSPTSPGQVNNAIDAFLKEAGEEAEQVVLEIPGNHDTLRLNSAGMNTLIEAGTDLVIISDDVAVNLPVALLEEILGRESRADIQITRTEDEDGNAKVSVNFTRAGGRAIGGFDTPVQVTTGLSDIDTANPHRIVALDRNGRPIGGSYNPRTGLFTLSVTGSTAFTIAEVPDLVRLRLVPGSTLLTDLAGNVPDVRMDTAPIIQDGAILVPVSFIGTALGFGAEWNPYTQEVTLSQNGRSFTFNTDHPQAQLIDGRAFTALDFTGRLFGAFVNWNAETGMIEVVR